MEIIQSGKTYGLNDINPELPQQQITFSDGESSGTTTQEVLDVLVSKVQLTNRTKGTNKMALLHLKLAAEYMEE